MNKQQFEEFGFKVKRPTKFVWKSNLDMSIVCNKDSLHLLIPASVVRSIGAKSKSYVELMIGKGGIAIIPSRETNPNARYLTGSNYVNFHDAVDVFELTVGDHFVLKTEIYEEGRAAVGRVSDELMARVRSNRKQA